MKKLIQWVHFIDKRLPLFLAMPEDAGIVSWKMLKQFGKNYYHPLYEEEGAYVCQDTYFQTQGLLYFALYQLYQYGRSPKLPKIEALYSGKRAAYWLLKAFMYQEHGAYRTLYSLVPECFMEGYTIDGKLQAIRRVLARLHDFTQEVSNLERKIKRYDRGSFMAYCMAHSKCHPSKIVLHPLARVIRLSRSVGSIVKGITGIRLFPVRKGEQPCL